MIVPTLQRGNALQDAPRPPSTQSVDPCVTTRSVGTINLPLAGLLQMRGAASGSE